MGVAIVGMTKNETTDDNGDGVLTVSQESFDFFFRVRFLFFDYNVILGKTKQTVEPTKSSLFFFLETMALECFSNRAPLFPSLSPKLNVFIKCQIKYFHSNL